jgi:hypothetical protein
MKRRMVLAGLLRCLAAAPALAQDPVDRIVRELRALGYAEVDVSRTMLGRARVYARSADAEREIILNPRTGEILRDLWIPRAGATAGGGLIPVEDESGKGRGRGGDDDDEEEDDDGDEDDGDDDGEDDGDGDDGDDSGPGGGG